MTEQTRFHCQWMMPHHAFEEVCRSVLNPQSMVFVAANAPSRVVTSFESRQRRLARFSLQVASAVLFERLTEDRRFLAGPFEHFVRMSAAKVKSISLWFMCALGRVGLEVVQGLRHGLPRQLQLMLSSKIISRVGMMLVDTDIYEARLSGEQSGDFVAANRAPVATITTIPLAASPVVQDILNALEMSLPTDMARLIFLATVRDNNSGHYYHPEVARRYSPEIADAAMLACHKQIYERVVSLSLEDLTDQLDDYMATVRASKNRLIESWSKLRAYRATIPMDTDPISAEIFFMKVDVAVAILGARLSSVIQ